MSQRFISESDIAENKKKLKEAWDATKGEADDENPPEPEESLPDHRSLFHRLEEQRLKKQEDYDDAHRLKNMVRGLEDEEVQFLDLVDRTKMEQEQRVRDEEISALEDFRKRRVEMEMAMSAEKVTAATQSTSATSAKTVKTSQKSLLLGAIKRKSSDTPVTENPAKKPRTESTTDEGVDDTVAQPSPDTAATETRDNTITSSPSAPPPPGSNGYLQCAGVLPGLGNYNSDSSSSDQSSSDSEPDLPLMPRSVLKHRHKGGQKGGCC